MRWSTLIALGLLLRAGTSAAALAPAGLGSVAGPQQGVNGRGVAVTSSGSVALVGRDQNVCGAIAGFRLTWFKPSLTVGTSFTFGEVCMDTSPRGIIALGDDVLVYGSANGHGYISLVHRDGGAPAFTRDEYAVDQGFWDAAIDPVDNTLWIIGYKGTPAPGVAHLLHYRVDGGGLALISDDAYAAQPGQDTQGWAVAAAEDGVYLGGTWNSAGIQQSWMARRPRSGDFGQPWLKSSGLNGNGIWSIAARGTHLYTETITTAGSPYNAYLEQHAVGDGSQQGSSTPLFSGNAPTFGSFSGQIAMHPTLPLLAIAGGTKLRVKDFDLNDLGGYDGNLGTATITEVDGAAFSNELEFTAYAAATVDIAAFPHMQLDAKQFSDAARTTSVRQMIIAPNVMVLSSALSFIRISVVRTAPGGSVHFQVFDGAGRFIAEKTLITGDRSAVEWLWDGTLPDGKQRIGPGAYIVRVDGTGSDAFVLRDSFLAVKKR